MADTFFFGNQMADTDVYGKDILRARLHCCRNNKEPYVPLEFQRYPLFFNLGMMIKLRTF